MRKSPKLSPPEADHEPSPLASLLAKLADEEGFPPTALPGVRLMHSRGTLPPSPVVYEPGIVIVAQGTKHGRVGDRIFVYDASRYLALAVPIPFECRTVGTPEKPMLGLAISINSLMVAELVLEAGTPWPPAPEFPRAIDSAPMTPEMLDAAIRLAKCLQTPGEARVLGPQTVREIVYRVLCGERGHSLRSMAADQHTLNRIACALRLIHLHFAEPLDVPELAREASMSVSTFHAKFKAVTASSPQRYLQTIRLHKAQAAIAGGVSIAEAALQVGYESPSQFSREFKRLFGGTPTELGRRRSSFFSYES